MQAGDIVNFLSPPLDKKSCEKLLEYYAQAKNDHLLCRWSDAITKYGKFLEITARMIYEYASQDNKTFPACNRYVDEIKKLHNLPNNLRLITTQIILSGYNIRNDRDAAHPTTKIDSNEIDCNYVSSACDWILCELLVEFGDKNRYEADDIIHSILNRKISLVYETSDGNLILLMNNNNSIWLRAAMLLYVTKKNMTYEQISAGIREDKKAVRNILYKHKDYFYQLSDGKYELLPPGMVKVEEELHSVNS